MTLNKYLFKKVYLGFTVTLIIISAALFYFVFEKLQAEIVKRQQLNQNKLIEEASNDLLSGLDFKVYQKCKALLLDEEIIGVELAKEDGQLICNLSSDSASGYTLETTIHFDEAKQNMAARAEVKYSNKPINVIRKQVLVALLGLLFLLLYLIFRAKNELRLALIAPLERLSEILGHTQDGKIHTETIDSNIVEINQIYNSINDLNSSLETYKAELILKTKDQALAEMARQVAHDIKSPLTALKMLANSSAQMPEKERRLLKMAVERVNDISNDLLVKKNPVDQFEVKGQTASALLWVVVDSLLSEKRIQYQDKPEVKVRFNLSKESHNLFAQVDVVQLKRALSNIINNSFEAIEGDGVIDIEIGHQGEYSFVLVRDNGCGMSPEQIGRAGEYGYSTGKEKSDAGLGLGLYGVKKLVDEVKGQLEISSEEGTGTTIKLLIPQQKPPTCFVGEVQLNTKTQVVILDDDPSVHEVWKFRFKEFNLDQPLIHFSSTQEAASFNFNRENTLFLCDFEIVGSPKSGLDLIVELGLESRALLVTSRFQESDIIENCKKANCRLLPKPLINLVEILFDK